jgi:homoserine dehydrogenase
MKIMLIGFGNVGKEVKKVLEKHHFTIGYIVKSSGLYKDEVKIAEKESFYNYVDNQTFVFISLPSADTGERIENYYVKSLDCGARIITCEKAFLANHWEVVKKHNGKIRYSATVGGNSGILNAVSDFKDSIFEIKAVVNGTLNYIGEMLAKGRDKESVFLDVTRNGFAEPGSGSFDEVVRKELVDVTYKAAILANHSGIFRDVIYPNNVVTVGYNIDSRCSVHIDKQGVRAGFINGKDVFWLPKGINNIIFINGQKIAEGLGAGGKITAERMFLDFRELALI